MLPGGRSHRCGSQRKPLVPGRFIPGSKVKNE